MTTSLQKRAAKYGITDERCYKCHSPYIHKHDVKGPLCKDCADGVQRQPFTVDDKTGVKTYDLSGRRGFFRRTKESRPGDIILDGKKKYVIQKDGSMKRVDKRRSK